MLTSLSRWLLRLAGATCALSAAGLSLTACGPKIIKPPPSATFTTQIEPGGLKFFVYQWGNLSGGAVSTSTISERARQTVPESDLPPAFYVVDHRASFESALKTKLEETQYCREGYYELSSHYVPGEFRLRGECKELASEQDRAQFVNASSQ